LPSYLIILMGGYRRMNMYVWQMNDGRWHVSTLTSTAWHTSMQVFDSGFETRKEAEQALKDWRASGGVERSRW
jgi:hypothetical protein